MANPPSSIKVGYNDYTIVMTSELKMNEDGNLGDCRNIPGIIRISSLLTGYQLVNIVLHEIMHACWYTMGLGENKLKEEKCVNGLTNGLVGVLRDNPELLKWVQKELR